MKSNSLLMKVSSTFMSNVSNHFLSSNHFRNYKIGMKYPRSKVMCEKTNRLAEKISKLIQFVIVDVSVVGFVLPIGIYSYFIYFTTELGADAFELPIPSWWVDFLGVNFYIHVLLFNDCAAAQYVHQHWVHSMMKWRFFWQNPGARSWSLMLSRGSLFIECSIKTRHDSSLNC